MGTPFLIPMQVTLPPMELVGVSSLGLIPPSPFSLYPAEVTNPSPNRAGSGNTPFWGLTEKACAASAEKKTTERGSENPYLS